MKTQKIRLACQIRPREVTEALEDYSNEKSYYLNGKRLSLEKSLKVRNHSPAGFNHGYGGSGPAQLALAICIELYGEPLAQRVYQDFKWKHIGSLPAQDEEFDVELEVPELL